MKISYTHRQFESFLAITLNGKLQALSVIFERRRFGDYKNEYKISL